MKKGFTHESTHNKSKEWYTPREIFDALGLAFDLDPCSPPHEVVPWIPALYYYTIEDDGLVQDWNGCCWVNPPYGSDTPKWMHKLASHGNGIALVFSRTDTKWFQRYVPKADAICFISGRIQFVPARKAAAYAEGRYRPKGGCGAGSMLVAYGSRCAEAVLKCKLGMVLSIGKK